MCTTAQPSSALALKCIGTLHATDFFTYCVFARCAYSHTPVIHETPPAQLPVTPLIDTQPDTPLPTPSTDDAPMPLPHDNDTPPWVYQEPETLWTPTEQDTPAIIPQQVPSPHASFSVTRKSRICPLVIQSFRSHLGSTKLHRRHQQHMTKSCLRSLRLPRLHQSKLRTPQKLRPFHLWQSVGDPEHFISRILYRSFSHPIRCIRRLLFRPQRFHSFGGVQVSCVPCQTLRK